MDESSQRQANFLSGFGKSVKTRLGGHAQQSVFKRIALPIVVTFLLGAGMTVFYVPDLLRQNAIASAIANAQSTAEQFKSLRAYYTEFVVQKTMGSDISTSAEHHTTPKAIPLPATLIHDMSERIGANGTAVRLYSPYPFPNRSNRQLDEFAQQAWTQLTESPQEYYYREQQQQDRISVRVGIADRMVNNTCVACHNHHPDTPKIGWKLGDVRGILEIETDITAEVARGMETAAKVLGLLAVLAIIVLGTTWWAIKKRVIGPVKQAVDSAQRIAQQDYSCELQHQSRDEMGELSNALMHMQEQLKHASESQREYHREMAKINQALDSASSHVLLLDESHKVLFANQAATRLISDFQQQGLFSATTEILHGRPISDLFPACRGDLCQYDKNNPLAFALGTHQLSVIASPVRDRQQQVLGTVLEVIDRTHECAVQADIQAMLDSAAQGDLAHRLHTHPGQGFFHQLGQGMNSLIDLYQCVIDDCRKVMSAMAQGQMTESMRPGYRGDLARLAEDTLTSIDTISRVVSDIQQAAHHIESETHAVSEGNQSLNHRTQEQAASIEQTAAAMEELTITVKKNAENAKMATELASQAQSLAECGGDTVNNTIHAINDIHSASERIVKIIDVMDEISFQTNMLALNAAVEAARAGEHGRSFAVVASEVRSLAQRSEASSKEIKTLIDDSVQKIQQGTRLANESGSTLEDIVRATTRVNDIMAEIATASEQQSCGLEETGQALRNIDDVTQKNAIMVSEASDAIHAVREQAHGMSRLLAFFEVKRTA